MREIKFRAWDKKTKRYTADTPYWVLQDSGVMFPFFEAQGQVVLMQSTGLKDRLGVDIYEGDILAYYKTQMTSGTEFEDERQRKAVVWKEVNGLGVGFNIGPPRKRRDGGKPQNNWEVIGNIFENPELLEGRNARD